MYFCGTSCLKIQTIYLCGGIHDRLSDQQGKAPFKQRNPITFDNRKHLKGGAKIPIPKQIEDEVRDRIQTKPSKNREKNILGHRPGKLENFHRVPPRNAMYLK